MLVLYGLKIKVLWVVRFFGGVFGGSSSNPNLDSPLIFLGACTEAVWKISALAFFVVHILSCTTFT
jgi:hypothetical protein